MSSSKAKRLNSDAKKRKLFTLKEKEKIIARVENGEKQIEIAKELGVSRTSINTIWSSREKIVDAVKTAGSGARKIASKQQRHPVMDEMEKLLIIWIENMQMRGDPVSGDHLSTKARKIFQELLKDYPDEENDIFSDEPFEEDEGRDKKGFVG
jgi:DNA-binding XRE family transcriptional regulator